MAVEQNTDEFIEELASKSSLTYPDARDILEFLDDPTTSEITKTSLRGLFQYMYKDNPKILRVFALAFFSMKILEPTINETILPRVKCIMTMHEVMGHLLTEEAVRNRVAEYL